MARPGRPRKHDPISDEIRRHIRNLDDDQAKTLIEEKGTELTDGEGCTPLFWASFHNRPELLKWLIARKANINHQDRNGYCALHYVAQEKLANIAQLLLEAGAATELRDVYGNTPLWTAAFSARGDFGVVERLLAFGASLENQNHAGKTVRDIAIMFFPDRLDELIAKADAESRTRKCV